MYSSTVYARSRISVSFPCIYLKNKGKSRTSENQMKRTKTHAFIVYLYTKRTKKNHDYIAKKQ